MGPPRGTRLTDFLLEEPPPNGVRPGGLPRPVAPAISRAPGVPLARRADGLWGIV